MWLCEWNWRIRYKCEYMVYTWNVLSTVIILSMLTLYHIYLCILITPEFFPAWYTPFHSCITGNWKNLWLGPMSMASDWNLPGWLSHSQNFLLAAAGCLSPGHWGSVKFSAPSLSYHDCRSKFSTINSSDLTDINSCLPQIEFPAFQWHVKRLKFCYPFPFDCWEQLSSNYGHHSPASGLAI